MTLNTTQDLLLKRIGDNLERLADAIEAQNKVLNDVVIYPADMTQPPRVVVGVAGAVETTPT